MSSREPFQVADRLRQVERLLNERDGKEQELVELLKLSPQDIWNRDLENFVGEWEVGPLGTLSLS